MKTNHPIPYYPIYLNLIDKKVLVVGGGLIALEKTKKLYEAQATITIIAKKVHADFKKLEGIQIEERAFKKEDVMPFFLVIGATNDPIVNQLIYDVCEAENKLVNIVDVTALCRFVVPATVRRGDLLMAVSTGGRSPFLSKQIAKDLREHYGEDYETYVAVLGEARDKLKEKVKSFQERLPYFQKMLAPEIKTMIFEGHLEEAREKLNEIVMS